MLSKEAELSVDSTIRVGAPSRAASVPRGWLRPSVYLELSKARLCALVVMTALVGFLLAGGDGWLRLVITLVGTALAAFGANALNQCWEVQRDGRMQRTRGRPLPSGRLRARPAWIYGAATTLVGPMVLAIGVNLLTAGLALGCAALYVLVYTPLKVRTPLNTMVGAVCGAIPPVMGWSAATGTLGFGGLLLGAILFLWQVPHFLALAWLYREDYERGGFEMLPQRDPEGAKTGQISVLYCLALLPLGLALALAGLAGQLYVVGSLILGVGLLYCGVRFDRERSAGAARRLFLASVIYLPLLLGLAVVDQRKPPAALSGAIVSSWPTPERLPANLDELSGADSARE